MCGSTEIDGYTFCLGVESLKLYYEAHPDLQSMIRSITCLIRRSIFRPKHARSYSGRVSLDIRPLGELIDMYHTHEATRVHDKVYALLGMSSDDPTTAGLFPDYCVTWEELLKRLVKFLLCEKVSVETFNNKEMAVIKSKGCILGYVSSVVTDMPSDGIQNVEITLKNIPRYLGGKGEWSARWTLPASAKSIHRGDLVCLLQGVSKPMIIRRREDHFAVIIITATPTGDVRTENGDMRWPELIRSLTTFPHDFLLVWNWRVFPGNWQDRAGFETLVERNTLVPEHLKAIRLRNVALILEDSGEYEYAEKKFQEAIRSYEMAFGEEHPNTLTVMDNLASVYKNKKQWKEAEKLSLQVIRTRKRVQGIRHPETLSSIADLESTYRDQGRLKGTEKLEVMVHLLEQRDDAAQISQEEVVEIARSFNKEVMTLLLEARGDEVHVTEEVVKAVAGNWRNGAGLMALLLEQRGNDVAITEEVVKAAAGNREVITLLLEQRGDEVPIIEEVVKAAAENKKLMTLLLKRRGDEVPITEEIMVQIAGSFDKEVMSLLFWQRRDKVPITEEVLKAAAGNMGSGEEVMSLLLEQTGDKVLITEEVVKAAAGNRGSGEEVMRLLLDRRGDKVPITEEVVKAAASNENRGKAVLTVLLDRRGDEIPITEEVVKIVAGNRRSGEEVIRLLLNRRGDKVPITEEVIRIARSLHKEVMTLLFEQRGDEVSVTEEVINTAVGILVLMAYDDY
jgi:tetratricopeptide (TPR) repeat protein